MKRETRILQGFLERLDFDYKSIKISPKQDFILLSLARGDFQYSIRLSEDTASLMIFHYDGQGFSRKLDDTGIIEFKGNEEDTIEWLTTYTMKFALSNC